MPPVGGFDFDVIVVGAGPAGATTALALLGAHPAARGRVAMLDRAKFPREKPCAGALGDRGDGILRRLGAHVDVPSVHFDGIAFRGRLGMTTASPGRIGRVVRRIEFDDALARIAVARGAELRDGVRVTAVTDEGDAGVAVQTSAGVLRARAVVGADGVGSVVRKALGVGPGRLRAQVVEVDTEPLDDDLDRSLILFDATDRALHGYAWDFPTIVGGRALVCRGIYRLKVGAPEGEGEGGEGTDRTAGEADVTALLDARLRAQGLDPAACRHKRYAERGFEPATVVARGAILLAGEAAGIDPLTGEGIAQAIEYGALAGRFLASRLGASGAVSLDGWRRTLGTSRLALDLRVRRRFVEIFYGAARPELEAFLRDAPELMHIGCVHFAAQRQDWLSVAEVMTRGGARALAHAVSSVLRGGAADA